MRGFITAVGDIAHINAAQTSLAFSQLLCFHLVAALQILAAGLHFSG
jgi:hypothetical protein